jgi:hypothetical protein
LEHFSKGILEMKTDIPEIIAESEADGQIKTGSDQQNGHPGTPHKIRNGGQELKQHSSNLPLFSFLRMLKMQYVVILSYGKGCYKLFCVFLQPGITDQTHDFDSSGCKIWR